MKIAILRQEQLEGVISKKWIYEHRNDKMPIDYKGYQIVIERDDMYNIVASFLNKDNEVEQGLFEELAVIEF